MNISGWLQLALFLVVLILITRPLGIYLFQVLDANGKTFLDPVIKPFERLTYRILGVKPGKRAGLDSLHHRDADFPAGYNASHLLDSALSELPAL